MYRINQIFPATDLASLNDDSLQKCYRNCNDCNDDPLGTGVQCLYSLPQKLEEGDELTLTFEREAEVQSEPFQLGTVHI